MDRRGGSDRSQSYLTKRQGQNKMHRRTANGHRSDPEPRAANYQDAAL